MVADAIAREFPEICIMAEKKNHRLADANNIAAETLGHQLMIRGATRASVSQLAFDNRIRLTELTETSKSLEDTLLDMTSASAEFAAA